MAKSVIVYGPQGCGKTRNAEKLRARFGLARIVDEGKIAYLLSKGPKLDSEGVLYLCVSPPSISKCNGALLISFHRAMQLV